MEKDKPSDQKQTDDKKSAIEAEEERLRKAAEESRPSATHQLEQEDIDSIPLVSGLAFGTKIDDATSYRVLPAHLAAGDKTKQAPRWRIELQNPAHGKETEGLEIVGDVVLGRGKEGKDAPDFSLDDYDADNLGVSRRHALLRPTQSNLYLIDLGSTNGTFINAIPVSRGTARAISHNDTIALGKLNFTIKIIARPPKKPRGES